MTKAVEWSERHPLLILGSRGNPSRTSNPKGLYSEYTNLTFGERFWGLQGAFAPPWTVHFRHDEEGHPLLLLTSGVT